MCIEHSFTDLTIYPPFLQQPLPTPEHVSLTIMVLANFWKQGVQIEVS